MEKPGMVRGSGFYRTGLLAVCRRLFGRAVGLEPEATGVRNAPGIHPLFGLALFALLAALPSPVLGGQDLQDGAGELAVMLESAPEHPVLGGSWRISILVNHPVPEEVTVIPPELPSSLTFAQFRKETRFVGTSPEQETRWTLAEFLFVPHKTGEIVLGPFEALSGAFRALTPAARTTVIAGEGEREEYHPRLAWDTPPAPFRIGEAGELSLRVLDGDPRKPLRRLPLSVTVPVEALLEEIPLTGEDLSRGLALRLRLIPLEGNRISLGSFLLRFETLTMEAPAISIALAPPRPSVSPPAPMGTDPGALSPETGAAFDGPAPDAPATPAFPEVLGEPFPLFRNAYWETLDKAREYWGQTRYAEALGELRRGERDLLSGPTLASTRRAAERLLGLPLTEDEKWRPRNCFAALILLSFCLLLLTVALPLSARRCASGKKDVTSLFFHGYSIVAFVLIGIMGFGIAALACSPGGFEGFVQGGAVERAAGKHPGNVAAVLLSCAAYRVPDVRGAISARWTEGQPVRVRFASDTWAYAESSGGDAGWVSQDKVVFY